MIADIREKPHEHANQKFSNNANASARFRACRRVIGEAPDSLLAQAAATS